MAQTEERVLMKGNEVLAEAAMRAGCRYFFGYPITPQTELAAYMARMLPKVGGTFLQAESEIAAINMVYGAAAAGARAMTSSSSPGISLKGEGVSYMAGADLPGVIINVERGGPGLGGIQPSQSDYFQATRAMGHGDFYMPVLAPSTVQEMADLVYLAFDLADEYRTPAMILADGMIGQMMEPIVWREIPKRDLPAKDWATTGRHGRSHNNIVNSLYIDPEGCDKHNAHLEEKYALIREKEVRFETRECDDAELVFTAYGTPARIVLTAMETLRSQGIKVGLFRPITLWPFPEEPLHKLAAAEHVKIFLDVEMSSSGQMLDDVRLGVEGQKPIRYLGHAGGVMPTVEEMVEAAKKALKEAE